MNNNNKVNGEVTTGKKKASLRYDMFKKVERYNLANKFHV